VPIPKGLFHISVYERPRDLKAAARRRCVTAPKLAAGAAGLCLLASSAGAFAQPTPHDDGAGLDWTRLVPGDTRFFVEIRGLSAIRRQFRDLGIWETIQAIRAHGTAAATSQPWQKRTEELLGLDPDAAIDQLLGRRSALIAAEPGQWENGVLLAELEDAAHVGRWVSRWRGQRLADEGGVQRYVLRGGLLLAAAGKLMALGPAGDPDGLWARTVLLMAGRRGPTLGGRADFAALRSSLSPDPRGLLYAAWPEDDPYAVAGCRRLLVGAWFEPSGIVCELQGHRDETLADVGSIDPELLMTLPASSLLVWAGNLDFAGLAKHAQPMDTADSSLTGLILSVLSWTLPGKDSLADSLGPACRIVVGRDSPARSLEFQLPAIGVICKAREAERFVESLDGILGLLGQGLEVMSPPSGDRVPQASVRVSRCEDVDLHSIKIGPALSRRLGLDVLREVEIAWAKIDEELIVSTSLRHAEEIIRAARGKAARFSPRDARRSGAPDGGPDRKLTECIYLRGDALAHMLDSWLRYLERSHPECLDAGWWQSWGRRRLEERDRLGLALGPDPADPTRAVVLEISAASQAIAFLSPGDVIVGAAGKSLVTNRPAAEVAERYAERADADEFSLDVLREGEPVRVRIPVSPRRAIDLTGFDPVLAVRQLTALTRRAESIALRRYVSKPDRLSAEIHIGWSAREPAVGIGR